jgi:hypothetical protein
MQKFWLSGIWKLLRRPVCVFENGLALQSLSFDFAQLPNRYFAAWPVIISMKVLLTLNSYCISFSTTQNLMRSTTACAAISWGNRSRMPAACVSRAVEYRMLSCSSTGRALSALLSSSCWAVASGFQRCDIDNWKLM